FFYRAANTLYSDGTRLDIPHKYFEDDADFFAALKSLPGLDQSWVFLNKRHKSPTELLNQPFFYLNWHLALPAGQIVEYSAF
ncbi:hypothetical protein, partial [Sapientia aquatica]|uniref:hypothetical protein n=1 Tax=Sapientia aquatica TaxID=1549640 RepID=UPI00197EC846